MVIDGNDDRGIDVGVLTRAGYEIVAIRSHVDDDGRSSATVFSRDCPEYLITTPTGARLVVLVNHLKSKGYGSPTTRTRSASGRRTQVKRDLRAAHSPTAKQNIVVARRPQRHTRLSTPLAPLLAQTDLKDISTHPSFTNDGRPGTYKNGTKSKKIDYLLLSPALFDKVIGGAVFRTGVWGGKNGTLWPHYQTMTETSTRPATTRPSTRTSTSRPPRTAGPALSWRGREVRRARFPRSRAGARSAARLRARGRARPGRAGGD